MSAFSWDKFIEQADKNLLRQAKTLAKKGQAQTKLERPNEVVDAQRGDYTKLTLRITNDLRVKRKNIRERRDRIGIGQR